jgi:amino acid transporter
VLRASCHRAQSLLAAINVLGVKGGTRAAVVLVFGKLTPLLIFIGVGALAVIPDRLLAPASVDPTRFGEAALLLMFAYAGFENTAAPAGEFKNPRRDVPFALFCEIAIVTLLYLSVQVVTLGVLADPGATKTPLADAGRFLLGPFGGLHMTVGAAISIHGTNSNTILSVRGTSGRSRTKASAAFRASRRVSTPDGHRVHDRHPAAFSSGTFKRLCPLSIVARSHSSRQRPINKCCRRPLGL